MLVYIWLGCAPQENSVEPARSENVPIRGSDEEVQQKIIIPEIQIFPIAYRYDSLPSLVYAAGNSINLRSSASTKGSVIAKVPLGNPIRVLATAQEEKIGTRKDKWYHIETTIKGNSYKGYLFGPTMTPHKIGADFDEDGEPEYILAAYNEHRELLLRVLDPNASSAVTWTNMGEYSYDGQVVDTAMLKLYPQDITGVSLLKIEAHADEKGFFWNKFISYSHGKVVRALEYTEQEKADSYQTVDLQFAAKTRSVLLRHITGQVVGDDSKEQTTVEKYRFSGGKYRSLVKKEVVSPPEEPSQKTEESNL